MRTFLIVFTICAIIFGIFKSCNSDQKEIEQNKEIQIQTITKTDTVYVHDTLYQGRDTVYIKEQNKDDVINNKKADVGERLFIDDKHSLEVYKLWEKYTKTGLQSDRFLFWNRAQELIPALKKDSWAYEPTSSYTNPSFKRTK